MTQASSLEGHRQALLEGLAARYPGRRRQMETLLHLCYDPSQLAPPSIFIQDAHTPALTSSLLRDLLSSLPPSSTSILPSQANSHRRSSSVYVSVSPATCPNPRVFYDRILRGLSPSFSHSGDGDEDDEDDGVSRGEKGKGKGRDDSLDAFLEGLRDLANSRNESAAHADGHGGSSSSSSLPSRENQTDVLKSLPTTCDRFTKIIVVEDAERMREGVWSTTWDALLRIGELTSMAYTTIFLSPVLWHKFRTSTGTQADPILIYMPKLGRQEIISHLGLSYRPRPSPLENVNDRLAPPDLKPLHTAFCALVHDTFSSRVCGLYELAYLASVLWPEFVAPVKEGRVPPTDIAQLKALSSGTFRSALDTVYPRQRWGVEWLRDVRRKEPEGREVEVVKDGVCGLGTGRPRQPTEPPTPTATLVLPSISKYILIASFLASYNPSRLDKRYFLREEALEGRRKRKRGGGRVMAGGGGKRGKGEEGDGESLDRQQLLGPRPFPLERMLAIFQAIRAESDKIDVDVSGDKVEREGAELQDAMVRKEEGMEVAEEEAQSLAVWNQINALITCRLLHRTSATERLDGIHLRANVSYETVRQLAKEVRFDIGAWLWDWAG